MVAWPSRGFRSPHEGLVAVEFWPNRGGLIWTWWLEKRLLIGLLSSCDWQFGIDVKSNSDLVRRREERKEGQKRESERNLRWGGCLWRNLWMRRFLKKNYFHFGFDVVQMTILPVDCHIKRFLFILRVRNWNL
ncbi:hypothetical protein Pint_10927 [Pistacia integerrima]|uniref:Uncharacterized protein n=1 Tax=Pistacia integerrima TaxID=434235 RepID=A0ACC0XHJ2_9ROSI|nr:hypothetical protein Pint_10927 [Pistacia integerrima]